MRTTPWQEEEDREVLSCEWLQTQVFYYYYFLPIVLVFVPWWSTSPYILTC